MSESKQKKENKCRWAVKKNIFIFLLGLTFAIVCFIGINAAMAPSSKSEYCGTQCHEMKTAYQSWELSVHGANKFGIQVGCVSCHLPPKEKYFKYIALKAYAGAKDVYKHHFGGDYDIEKTIAMVLESIPNKRYMH